MGFNPFNPVDYLTGGMDLLGGFHSAHQARSAASDMRQFNREEAEKNRDFQADQARIARTFTSQMSSSAYQRSMADMKAAGLNPILAYSQGGASTPQGSPAAGSQAHATLGENPGKALFESATAQAMRRNLDAQAFKTRQEGRVSKKIADVADIAGAPATAAHAIRDAVQGWADGTTWNKIRGQIQNFGSSARQYSVPLTIEINRAEGKPGRKWRPGE